MAFIITTKILVDLPTLPEAVLKLNDVLNGNVFDYGYYEAVPISDEIHDAIVNDTYESGEAFPGSVELIAKPEPFRLTDADLATLRSLRDRGCAIALFNPNELDGAWQAEVEFAMVHRGWDAIEQGKPLGAPLVLNEGKFPAITAAAFHVADLYPGVCLVKFDDDDTWVYANASGHCPAFDKCMNDNLLFEAQREAYKSFTLPITIDFSEALNRRKDNKYAHEGAFNTGRMYSDKGQRIGWVYDEGKFYFHDMDRSISGVVDNDGTPGHTPNYILRAYDSGRYVDASAQMPQIQRAMKLAAGCYPV